MVTLEYFAEIAPPNPPWILPFSSGAAAMAVFPPPSPRISLGEGSVVTVFWVIWQLSPFINNLEIDK